MVHVVQVNGWMDGSCGWPLTRNFSKAASAEILRYTDRLHTDLDRNLLQAASGRRRRDISINLIIITLFKLEQHAPLKVM